MNFILNVPTKLYFMCIQMGGPLLATLHYYQVQCCQRLPHNKLQVRARYDYMQGMIMIIELLFVFVEAVFVAPRSEELCIAT